MFSAKTKSFFKATWEAAVGLMLGLFLVVYFGLNLVHPPVNTDEMSVYVFMPIGAEVRQEEGVRAVTQVRGGEAGPFRIFVSQDEFAQLVSRSSYQPLVSHTTEGSINPCFTQEYWLSRGDGAWYTTTHQVQAKYWNFWWDTKWVRQTDTLWVARPVFDPFGSWVSLIIGAIFTVVSFIGCVATVQNWKDECRHYACS